MLIETEPKRTSVKLFQPPFQIPRKTFSGWSLVNIKQYGLLHTVINQNSIVGMALG